MRIFTAVTLIFQVIKQMKLRAALTLKIHLFTCIQLDFDWS